MRKIFSFFLILALLFSLSSCSSCRKDTKGYLEGETRLIAHRGLSGLMPENSEAAFILAGERSYYGIETDVRKTADGRFVLCHDATLERVAGVDIDIEGATYEELSQIRLLGSDGKETEEKIPLLESFIKICKEYEKEAVVEFKGSFSDEDISAIVDIIREIDYLDRVTFISFGYSELLAVRELLPQQKVQYLFSEVTDEIIDNLIADEIDASINFTALKRSTVKKLHDAGLEVGTWTLDYRALARYASLLGVDYITTNILE